MNNLAQLKNSSNKIKVGKVKILEKELVDATLNAVKILCKHDKEIRITLNPTTLVFSHYEQNKEEYIIFIIQLNDKSKIEIENLSNFHYFSIFVDSQEFLRSIQTVKEFEKMIYFELHPDTKHCNLIIMKIKTKSDNNSVFRTKIECKFQKEENEFQYEIKNYFFKLNLENIESIMSLAKYYKSEYISFVLHEKTLDLVINQDEKNHLNGDFIIKGDNHNYEKSFKEICIFNSVAQKEIPKTVLTFNFSLKKLHLICSKILDKDDYFYLNYEDYKLGNQQECIKSHFLKKKNNSKLFDFIVLTSVRFEKKQGDMKKKGNEEQLKCNSKSDLISLSNKISESQLQKSNNTSKYKIRGSNEEAERNEEKLKPISENTIKNTQNKISYSNKQSKNEVKGDINPFSKKKEIERNKVDFNAEPEF